MCQNHNGEMPILKRMIEKAGEAGAWSAKIQTFFADDLSAEWKDDYDRLKKLELSWSSHRAFVAWCKDAGLVPMTSVYSKKYAGILHEIGFRWVKIGSAQSADQDLIRYYKMFGFNVIISTGGRPLKSIPKIWPLEGVLHCVSKYPHSPYEASIRRMLEIKYSWRKSACGFSDHTDPTHREWFLPSCLAMTLGASYIEKHFTVLMPHQTKDGPVSIDFKKLKFLCEFAKMNKEDQVREMERKSLIRVLRQVNVPEEFKVIDKYQHRWIKDPDVIK